eukprot:CAMPEP_0206591256 /NCGR_PEP_ID=MMETSP0325_2-20121206/40141_1 /ASSEMBLY_ACC=CAM_ASM_000347 /TAXON_ID=2866 /ORGANISM="Crypthecodinium cohnii, Strain Seligo" /LENGTH=119 /DNA_ID=CAMNT_0054100433 /DNA_START=14 /DNA_END=370 /DNA_ORIENTATION=-
MKACRRNVQNWASWLCHKLGLLPCMGLMGYAERFCRTTTNEWKRNAPTRGRRDELNNNLREQSVMEEKGKNLVGRRGKGQTGTRSASAVYSALSLLGLPWLPTEALKSASLELGGGGCT